MFNMETYYTEVISRKRSLSKINAIKELGHFPVKIFRIASDPKYDSIWWGENGNHFIVNIPLFEEEFLRNPGVDDIDSFHSSSFASVIRQLNIYGFRKVTIDSDEYKDPDSWQRYMHPNFRRFCPYLLQFIERGKNMFGCSRFGIPKGYLGGLRLSKPGRRNKSPSWPRPKPVVKKQRSRKELITVFVPTPEYIREQKMKEDLKRKAMYTESVKNRGTNCKKKNKPVTISVPKQPIDPELDTRVYNAVLRNHARNDQQDNACSIYVKQITEGVWEVVGTDSPDSLARVVQSGDIETLESSQIGACAAETPSTEAAKPFAPNCQENSEIVLISDEKKEDNDENETVEENTVSNSSRPSTPINSKKSFTQFSQVESPACNVTVDQDPPPTALLTPPNVYTEELGDYFNELESNTEYFQLLHDIQFGHTK